ncbi:hypothetical protein B0T17DRAFT_615003 [Bombardia bombarda]|uniref:Uncharacterized protein n=1 Tax=Bombardia bombarda TaxID=252184 RepID=A0AA39X8B6_9PEZI|nr:hypothetical protein B0T17DRAFT_615003 [Bombardia bombarda]
MVHEVNVYRLLTKYTDIPVPDPKSISSDFDAAGRAYIRIERMETTVRASAALKRCWMPLEHRSSSTDADGPCDRFGRRALDGFVVPPRWVRMADGRERWEVKTGEEDEFVFVLHNLGPENLLLNRQTLQVAVLVNVEEAGYFPEEMQQRDV